MIDMMNYEYRNWKVIDRAPTPEHQKSGQAWWLCQCVECGFQKPLNGAEIRSGRSGACKHPTRESKKKQIKNVAEEKPVLKYRIKNEANKVYGKLKVIDFAYTKNGHAYWNCECECGNKTTVRGNSLRFGEIKSCGCIRSYKEQEIASILNTLDYINYKQEYAFKDLIDKSQLRFDFAIFYQNNLVGLIEYQGRQHFSSPEKFNHYGLLQIHDEMKQNYCKEHQIPLLCLNGQSQLDIEINNWLNEILKK